MFLKSSETYSQPIWLSTEIQTQVILPQKSFLNSPESFSIQLLNINNTWLIKYHLAEIG